MTKNQFLRALEGRLQGLPEEDMRKSLDYYGEMIDDRMEDGVAEEEAVAALGDMEEIVGQILADIPLAKLVGHKLKSRSALRGWEIALLIVGFPIWLPLLIVAGVLVLVALILFWALSLVFYAADIALAVMGVAFVLLAPVQIWGISLAAGLAILGCGLVCAGLSIPFFFLANWTFKELVRVSKWTMQGIKKAIIGKKEA